MISLPKFFRKALILTATALIAASGSYALSRTGFDAGRAITEARCRSGAFIYHSASPTTVTDDTSSTDVVVPQANLAGTSSGTGPEIIGPNLIPNSGLESMKESAPTSWFANANGQTKANFDVVAGHNSARAVRTTVTEYASGNANWYHAELKVQPGAYYQYTDYYRSDTSTRAILMLKDTAGKTQYVNLKSVGPATEWTRYQDTFFIPGNVTQAYVLHPLAARGYLETDDFSLAQARPVGFSHPMISVTFDDGWRGIYDHALPLMQRYGVVSTQYLVTGYLGRADNYVTPKQVYAMRDAGHEIASHSVDHVDLTKESAETVTRELKRSKQDLEKCFGPTTAFAAPYGTYSAETINQVKQHYTNARSTDTGYNTADNLNPYRLLVQNMTSTTTTSQLNDWIETARANRSWLILVYHDVAQSEDMYARKPADFERDLQIIKASGVSIETMQEAYDEAKFATTK